MRRSDPQEIGSVTKEFRWIELCGYCFVPFVFEENADLCSLPWC